MRCLFQSSFFRFRARLLGNPEGAQVERFMLLEGSSPDISEHALFKIVGFPVPQKSSAEERSHPYDIVNELSVFDGSINSR